MLMQRVISKLKKKFLKMGKKITTRSRCAAQEGDTGVRLNREKVKVNIGMWQVSVDETF